MNELSQWDIVKKMIGFHCFSRRHQHITYMDES
jgi:hypothetical protein